MAWSTRQLAELAGTSLRAVRHYHEVGLLDEPERRANGYKQYGVAHLIRLLRIKRLTDLGFSLPQIAEMGDADEHPEEALRALDSELATTIERLKRVRLELALVLRTSMPTDLPPALGAAAAGADLSEADRSLVVVMTRVMNPDAIESYAELLNEEHNEPEQQEFDTLPADADEETRIDLARRVAPQALAVLDRYPDLLKPASLGQRGISAGTETVIDAMDDIYNPAQFDVMKRVGVLIAKAIADKG